MGMCTRNFSSCWSGTASGFWPSCGSPAGPARGRREAVFSVYCPRHRRLVLLSPWDITDLCQRDGALEVHWRCSCGEQGVWRTDGGTVRAVAG
jgi:hypothetical protein